MYQSLYWSVTEWDCCGRSENDFAVDNNEGLLLTENEQTEKLFMLLDGLRADNPNWVVNTTNAGYKSGYRTIEVNAAVGGVDNSFHVQGCAADIHIETEDFAGEKLADIVIKKAIELDLLNEIGLGVYDDWVHLDTRGYSARW